MSNSNIWFYELEGKRNGPVSLQVIRSLSRKGIITKTTPVSEGSQDNWVPFSDLENRLTPAPATTVTPASSSPHTPAIARRAVPQFSPAAAQPAVHLTTPTTPKIQPSQPGVTGFGEAISVCLSKYFDFNGRANRAEYWYFLLFTMLINLMLLIVIGLLTSAMPSSSVAAVLPIAMLIVQLALFIPSLSAAVRRLHDTDKSGWWFLVGLIPLLGGIVLSVFLVQRGTLVPNRYG